MTESEQANQFNPPLSRRQALRIAATSAALGTAAAIGAPRTAGAAGRRGIGSADDTVLASSFGFDPVDATDALQQALDSTARTVVIDNVGTEWLTRPLHVNRDGFRVVVEPGVTVRAKPGGYPGTGDGLLSINDRSNVSIIGYGAVFKMNKQEYIDMADGGQWRHALRIESSTDIRVEGLTLASSGGDGIYIGRIADAGHAPLATNVTLLNVVADDNYRNALSVISADNLHIEGCAFVNTSGHSPQAGVDFEPNQSDEQLTNIVMRDCVTANNPTFGVTVSLKRFNDAQQPVSILLDRVRMSPPSGKPPVFTYYAPPTGDPGGTVELRDCYVETADKSGALGIYQKPADGARLIFTRTTAVDWGNQTDHYYPINVHAANLEDPAYGGVDWNDCVLVTDQPAPFLHAQDGTPPGSHIEDLTGNLTVVDPNGAEMFLDSDPTDIALQVTALSAPPPTTVTVQALRSTIRRGCPVTLLFTRSTTDVSAPLAIRYSQSGTAVERFDTDGSAGVATIPPGQSSVRASVGTRRLVDSSATKTATFTIEPAVYYTVGPSGGATVNIED